MPETTIRRELEEADIEERWLGQENRVKSWNQSDGLMGQKKDTQLARKNKPHCSSPRHKTALYPGSWIGAHGMNPS
ncbi:hypothetical protein [Candidatus Vondammii sp. HM_W22]|uniref:hypothetical protein n=1 Tax=Candidatus Vondammii sp. HM_W22 TaxID=2687299 RepID=UPI001F12D6D7|nr:hypothetical protein [Candidatus Vondammii sp. HM_W22]